jgi:hypothetical protein
VDPVPYPHFSENLAGLESNPGPLDLQPETLTTRPQRRIETYGFMAHLYIQRVMELNGLMAKSVFPKSFDDM